MSSLGFSNKVPITGRVRQCLELVKEQDLNGKVIVDIGSSFGWLEVQLANTGAKLIGIEPNQAAVEFSRKKLGTKARFEVGSALKIPEKNSSADIAIFFDVIEHVPVGTEVQALKEINRILKKNGLLLLSTPNFNVLSNLFDPAWYFGHRHYKFSQLNDLLKKSGFELVSHDIRGGFFSVFHMVWFYMMKWLLRINQPYSKMIEELDDSSYREQDGFVSHFIVARKILH